MRILMVCLGNICRSPLAHGILENKLQDSNYLIDSAGTASYHIGELPDHRSIKVAKANGIDITSQRARQFKTSDFDVFDRIYAMDESNLDNLKTLARDENDLNKLRLFMDANPNSAYNYVPDPYYGDFSGFEEVFNLVDETCNIIARDLSKQD
ncbi:low molecular weight protein-tyrosine-phosphatase [Winogradskyella aurantiaca]|uniref:low molecular weight protein-tyrosine-phosphatase n=1 Tax=Winogradskyella aurantiaca TaxID=2219558 RepID=UPI001E5F7A54|nr:low molecular weight protein-tyrosine-phosphatase [Winogradskyella aurantiaca]